MHIKQSRCKACAAFSLEHLLHSNILYLDCCYTHAFRMHRRPQSYVGQLSPDDVMLVLYIVSYLPQCECTGASSGSSTAGTCGHA